MSQILKKLKNKAINGSIANIFLLDLQKEKVPPDRIVELLNRSFLKLMLRGMQADLLAKKSL